MNEQRRGDLTKATMPCEVRSKKRAWVKMKRTAPAGHTRLCGGSGRAGGTLGGCGGQRGLGD